MALSTVPAATPTTSFFESYRLAVAAWIRRVPDPSASMLRLPDGSPLSYSDFAAEIERRTPLARQVVLAMQKHAWTSGKQDNAELLERLVDEQPRDPAYGFPLSSKKDSVTS